MADLDYAQSCIADIQAKLGEMTKDEIIQALEVVRVSLIPTLTIWTEPEKPNDD